VNRNLKLHWRRLRNLQSMKLHGVSVNCGSDDVPRAVRSALFKESYEAHECALVKREIGASDKVLEIGTGIGLVSLVATRICGEGNVLSCEANPAMEQLIRKNYALNGWQPNLLMKAVTSDGRDLTFFQDNNILSSSAFERGLESKKMTVQSAAISDLMKSHQPTVILMDVEGSEVELLPECDLDDVKKIIVEMHPHIVGAKKIEALVAQLTAQGFDLADTRHKTYLFKR